MEGSKNKKLRNAILVLITISAAAAATGWYLFTETFADTTKQKADYSINALDIINEFKKNDTLANKKYSEKIIKVTGVVTQIENADTTVNIKLGDTATGSYAIFAFQQQHLIEAKAIKYGDKVTIKGSCSGGAHSEILDAEFITFKRCALNK